MPVLPAVPDKFASNPMDNSTRTANHGRFASTGSTPAPREVFAPVVPWQCSDGYLLVIVGAHWLWQLTRNANSSYSWCSEPIPTTGSASNSTHIWSHIFHPQVGGWLAGNLLGKCSHCGSIKIKNKKCSV